MPTSASVIRCPIHGSIRLSQRELALIDSPFFQRLRSISQLGFTSYVFPGATHTRFSHSLGVLHLAGRIYDQIIQSQQESLTECYRQEQLTYFGQILRFGALLHDVGHPPFSHAAESVLPPLSALDVPRAIIGKENRQSTHEDFSSMIIYHLAENEGLLSMEEAIDIIGLLSKQHKPSERMNSKSGYPMIYPLLRQLISGEIDSDRMDYLLRDSYFAGVPYGRFDLDRLISSLTCCRDENLNQFLLAIDGEGVPAYEIFLLARIHMFYQIYFHKSLGAYRHYLAKAFDEGEIDISIDGSLENFLLNTENLWIEEFQANRDKKWSGRIHRRIPAKSLFRVLDGEIEKKTKLENIHEILQNNDIEVIISHSSNQFSTQIKNRNIDQNTVLVIDEEFGKRTVTPLSEKSSLLEPVEKQIEILQLYVLRESYDQAIQLLQDHLS
jgi:uncharacterized protein